MKEKKNMMPLVVLILGLAVIALAAVIYYFPRGSKPKTAIEENPTQAAIVEMLAEETITQTPAATSTPENIKESDKAAVDQNKYYGIGDTFVFDDLEISLLNVHVEKIDNQFEETEFAVLIDATVKNVSDKIHGFSLLDDTCYGSKGTQTGSAGAYFDAFGWMGDMRPDAVQEGVFAYDYDGDGEYLIIFDNYSEKVQILINVEK